MGIIGRGAIKGTVVAKGGGYIPIPGANVSVFYGGSETPYVSGQTDLNGVFNLDSVLSGEAKLSISYIGLETLNTDIHVNDSSDTTDLGTLYMSSGREKSK